jgi:hypothetical protein
MGDLSLRLDEAASLRLFAVSDTAENELIRSYFLSDRGDSSRLEIVNMITPHASDRWLLEYLKGQILMHEGKYSESLSSLTSLNIVSTDSLLEAIRLRMVGYDLFRLGRFEDARVTFWSSLNFLSTEVARDVIDDWVERCEWMEDQKRQ